MSEWKVCEDCDHYFRNHGYITGAGSWANGGCHIAGCDCRRFYTNPENF